MFRLAERADIPVSAIRKIFQQLPAIKEKRIKEGLSPLIDLSIGQPHIPANPEVMHNLAGLIPSPASQGYSPAQGEPETLATIAKLYNHYYPGVQFKTDEVMVTVGASGALSNIFSILVQKVIRVEKGILVEEPDVILTFEPYFGAYTAQIQEWGGVLKKIPTLKTNFRPTAGGLEQALQEYPNTKALVLNYPNNPSGISLTKEEVQALAQTLDKYPEVLIIIDDVYRDFNFKEHFTILDVAPHLKDRCIVINSGAKGLLGAPGARVGMVAAHEHLIKRMIPRQTNGISGVPYPTQAALRCAVESHLRNPNNEWLMNARAEYKTNVDIAAVAFKEQGFIFSHESGGAFYLLVSAKHLMGKKIPNTSEEIKSDVDIANYFLNVAGVAIVPGSGFGIDPAEGYLRISCANRNDLLIEAALRMGQAAQLLLEYELRNKVQKELQPVAPSNLLIFSLMSKAKGKQEMTKEETEFLIEHRHEDPRLLADFRQRFGMVLR